MATPRLGGESREDALLAVKSIRRTLGKREPLMPFPPCW